MVLGNGVPDRKETMHDEMSEWEKAPPTPEQITRIKVIRAAFAMVMNAMFFIRLSDNREAADVVNAYWTHAEDAVVGVSTDLANNATTRGYYDLLFSVSDAMHAAIQVQTYLARMDMMITVDLPDKGAFQPSEMLEMVIINLP